MYRSSSLPIILLSALATLNGTASGAFLLLRSWLPPTTAFFGAASLTLAWGVWLGLCGLYGTSVIKSFERPQARPRPLRLARRRSVFLP